jgi:ferredoxin, 2Fe-2S
MPKLIVRNASGVEREIEGRVGFSLMEILRDAGVPEILAICGGACSCATCHVHVEGGPVEALPPLGSDEDDLLDGSLHRAPNSRLSCQIRLEPRLDGLRLFVFSED